MRKIFYLMILAALLAACAGAGERSERPGEVYLKHAGEPVDRVRYGSVRGWQPVGDDAVLLDFGSRGHYLFELSLNCRMDARSASTIALETQMRSTVSRFDTIVVGRERCTIQDIRPVDYEAARAEMRDRGDEGPNRSVTERVVEPGDQSDSGGT
jgi:hypothetical protein